MSTVHAADAGVAAPAAPRAHRRHLYGPVADFLLLGGSSLILAPLALLGPAAQIAAPVAAVTWMGVNLVNHPHFAHSYQIFYRGYGTKAFGSATPTPLRARYVFAGLVVPLLLAALLGYGIAASDRRVLGWGGNLMALFVGWHYAKQGYGMLMVDAALKRAFFGDLEKKAFLVNAYAVWIFAWLNTNHLVAVSNLWGLQYYAFDTPAPLRMAATAAAALTTAGALWALLRAWRSKGALPWTGVTAYLVSLYLWLVFLRVAPVWTLLIPALHSLQYLAVVWRFQANVEKAAGTERRFLGVTSWKGGLAFFILGGLALGAAGFWVLPILLGRGLGHGGPTVFLFVFWVFINIHHFFLDNVMWRRENPETRQHLFA